MTSSTIPVLEVSDTESIIDTTNDSNDFDTAPDSPGNSSLVLDLTKEEFDFINGLDDDERNGSGGSSSSRSVNKKEKNRESGTSAENVINLDDDAYAFFVEAGLDDPEELMQLGIDYEEIKQQQAIAKRLEEERKRDYEIASQLQRQYDSESQGASSSASQLPAAPIASSSTMPVPPLHTVKAEDRSTNAAMKRKMNDTSIPDMKRLRLDTPVDNAIEIDDDDDADVIDLTDENETFFYNLASDSDEEGYESDPVGLEAGIVDYLSGVPYNSKSRPYALTGQQLAERAAAAALRAEQEGYPYNHWNKGTTPIVPYMAGVQGGFAPYFNGNLQESHMANIAKLRNAFRNDLERNQPNITPAEAERELRELLMTVTDDQEIPPEQRAKTPDGLCIQLLEHQKIGVKWMCDKEESNNKGGLLADDMGLGKTIQAMAVIVARPCTDFTRLDHSLIPKNRTNVVGDMIKIKATLIVCPVSLMDQWRREIESKTDPSLKVLVYHGTRTKNPYDLALYDVIISSYTVTAGDFNERCKGPFSMVRFHRVILDEAHTIKNKATMSARGCYQLEATYRWCMTATPIQNKIEELYSLLHFLRIRPFCDWDEFRDAIVKPMKSNNHKKAIKVAHVLMKAIALRRSKKAKIDGRAILDLPERNVHMTHIDFSPDERLHYEYVNNRAQRRFNKYMQAGTVMKNYSSVLVLLLRLRQACLHPHLTVEEGEDPEAAQHVVDEGDQKKIAESMKPEVVSRLLSETATMSEIECPICMDIAVDAQINKSCGHILCKECLDAYINQNDGGPKRCPQCRGEMSKQNSVSVEVFCKVHAPELLKETEAEDEAVKEDEAEAAKKEKEALARVQEYISSAKIDKMLEILEDTSNESDGQDKTIVFSQFTGFLDLIGQPLKERGIKYLRYDGSMDIRERSHAVNKFFEDPEYRVMLVSTKCGSLGLNLTCANRVILMDIWWNPALENQAIDRVHRIGQQKPVEVHRIFIKDTVEDRILELQNKKQAIADGVLGEGGRRPLARLGLREMIYLFRGGDVPDPVEETSIEAGA